MELPVWAQKAEKYSPRDDRDFFISHSLLTLLPILSGLRASSGRRAPVDALSALTVLLVLIILTVSTRSTFFLWALLAGELVFLAVMPAELLKKILKASLSAAFFCALIVAPSFFLGNGRHMVLLPAKTFLTVTALSLLQENFPWNEITSALHRLHVPSLIVFILDTTLRYIVLLGDTAATLLTALKLRSVGKNPDKAKAMGGVMGVVFQKSMKCSKDMYDAMWCRGFTGDYPKPLPPEKKSKLPTCILLAFVLLYIDLFLVTERILP